MYCPNCKQNFEGKFCPECGTKLIEKPSAGGINLNLGDANAISGGINISNHIIERNKSNEELLLERKNRYRSLCRQYAADGKIDESERVMLDKLASELGLSKNDQNQILQTELESSRTKSTGLDKASKVVFIQITKKVKSFDLQGIVTLLPKLINMEHNFNDTPVKFYTFLLLSVLRPSECIRRFESHQEDNYWLTYWCVISYLLKGKSNKAEQAKTMLSNWAEYDEGNSLLLDIAISIKSGDFETAEAYRDVLEGTYSEELSDFAISLFNLLNNVGNLCAMVPEPQHAFYLKGMFYKELEIQSLGILQPDGTLSQGAVDPEQPKPFVPTVKLVSADECKKTNTEKKVALKDASPKPFSKSECKRLAAIDTNDGGIYLNKQEDGLFIVESEDKLYRLWDSAKETLLLDIVYQSLWMDDNGIYHYSIKNNYGDGLFCPDTMKQTIDNDCQWATFIESSDGLYEVLKKDDKGREVHGIIDMKDGCYVLEPLYEDIENREYYTVDGSLLIQDTTGKWGIFDTEEKDIVVNCEYKKIQLGDSRLYFFLIKNLSNADKGAGVYVPGAKALYKKAEGGVFIHDLFEHILFIYKTKEGPYAICNINHRNNVLEYFDNFMYDWYDEYVDEELVTPLVWVLKDEKVGLFDAENCCMLLDCEYDEMDGDGVDGSPYYILTKDGQEYTFNMFTRQFE